MPDPTTALAAIREAHKARSEVWTFLSDAEWDLLAGGGAHGAGGARTALADALDACDRMRAAIITARAEVGKLGAATMKGADNA
jgi:hypothetical protein